MCVFNEHKMAKGINAIKEVFLFSCERAKLFSFLY